MIVQDVTVHSANDSSKPENIKHRINNKVRTHKNENFNHERAYENIPLTTKITNAKKERPTTSSAYKTQKKDVHEYTNVVEKPTIKISRYDVIVESNKVEFNVRKNEKSRDIDSINKTATTSSYPNSSRHFQLPSNYNNLPLLKNSHTGESSHSKQPPNQELHKYKLSSERRSDRNVKVLNKQYNAKEMPLHRTLPKNLRELLANAEQLMNESSKNDESPARRSHVNAYDNLLSKSQGNIADIRSEVVEETVTDISLLPPAPPNFASPKCETRQNNEDEEQLSLISYQCLSSSQDEDDYR